MEERSERVAPTPNLNLTEEEERVLAFEQNFSGTRHRKEAQIRSLGMSVVHYYLIVERLLANPAVEEAYPHFVRARRAALERRLKERSLSCDDPEA